MSDRDPEELAYLSEQGITPDQRVEVLYVAPIGMMTVRVDGEEVALPDRVTEMIQVITVEAAEL